MGIDLWTARFLASEARRGVDFSQTLTLGRQSLCMTREEYATTLPQGFTPTTDAVGGFADELLASLGARSLDSIDVSDYEGANIIHDLNTPFVVPKERRWTCVFDGGALEHIFHFPTAIRSCMEATAIGGHFITACPWSGFAGHGFYQFSPELLYRVLSEENGFKVCRMLFHRRGEWLEVLDPKSVGHRLEYQSATPTLLFASAQRVAEVEIFARTPQQSDYQTMWAEASSPKSVGGPSTLRRMAELMAPDVVAQLRARREQQRMLSRGTVRVEL